MEHEGHVASSQQQEGRSVVPHVECYPLLRDWLLRGACHGAGYMLVLHVVLDKPTKYSISGGMERNRQFPALASSSPGLSYLFLSAIRATSKLLLHCHDTYMRLQNHRRKHLWVQQQRRAHAAVQVCVPVAPIFAEGW